ncbi:MAG TPA: polyphosphate polymerase domain-containing protein [Bacteroidales bacterium]|nr:polyphosphate polymerase domain-containing protein [Bacteroidales bacterium]HPS62384.1 polyphosphate polymerase domain-containing protein [Bacteroidales bacterium]
MSIIEDRVAGFGPITLEQMDEVKLLNRVDRKFIFGISQLPGILANLSKSYYALEIDGVRMQRYQTLYFDTPDHSLYRMHHNKRMNRFKVRNRKYLDSDLSYFEVKFKNNKDRTHKERKKVKGPQEMLDGKPAELLQKFTPYTSEHLQPSLWVWFSRLTLVNHAMTERATIDTGLSFRHGSEACNFPGLVIAEVKQDRSASSVIADVLHRHHVRGSRISKYCLGMITTHPGIKMNNFKQKLHHINKLSHDLL